MIACWGRCWDRLFLEIPLQHCDARIWNHEKKILLILKIVHNLIVYHNTSTWGHEVVLSIVRLTQPTLELELRLFCLLLGRATHEFRRSLSTLLGGPRDLVTTYNWAYNLTYNPPTWAYRSFANFK